MENEDIVTDEVEAGALLEDSQQERQASRADVRADHGWMVLELEGGERGAAIALEACGPVVGLAILG